MYVPLFHAPPCIYRVPVYSHMLLLHSLHTTFLTMLFTLHDIVNLFIN